MSECKEEYSERCFYCSKWIVVDGQGMCADDLEENEEQDENSKEKCNKFIG